MTKTMNRCAFEQMDDFGVGEPNPYGTYFTGQSYLAFLTPEGVTPGVANVTFEPGCRNFWHIHHASEGGGQLLLCTAGEGWYQEWGKPAQRLVPGTVVCISANVKHWHGAAADSWFSHLALELDGTDASTEWCESVSDDEYAALDRW